MTQSFKQFLFESTTNAKLALMYDRINRVAFGNELPPIKPRISSRLNRATGITTAKQQGGKLVGDIGIAISDKYILDDNTIEVILAHEMIHAWFFVNGDFKETHGIRFKAKAHEIGSKLNKTIPITHDTTGLKITRPPKKVGVVLFIRNDRISATFYNTNTFLREYEQIKSLAHIMKNHFMKSQRTQIRIFQADLMVAHSYPLARNSNSAKIYKVEDKEDIKELLLVTKYDTI
jgi:hypothetical protein